MGGVLKKLLTRIFRIGDKTHPFFTAMALLAPIAICILTTCRLSAVGPVCIRLRNRIAGVSGGG